MCTRKSQRTKIEYFEQEEEDEEEELDNKIIMVNIP